MFFVFSDTEKSKVMVLLNPCRAISAVVAKDVVFYVMVTREVANVYCCNNCQITITNQTNFHRRINDSSIDLSSFEMNVIGIDQMTIFLVSISTNSIAILVPENDDWYVIMDQPLLLPDSSLNSAVINVFYRDYVICSYLLVREGGILHLFDRNHVTNLEAVKVYSVDFLVISVDYTPSVDFFNCISLGTKYYSSKTYKSIYSTKK